MQMNFKLNKAGVSLIAVLLFMLVATIAATATWKWLSSEGKSSASRMLKREAYQSSVAGIENARSWMTFHANDVGAIIKQYLDDPQRKAINLDEQGHYHLPSIPAFPDPTYRHNKHGVHRNTFFEHRQLLT